MGKTNPDEQTAREQKYGTEKAAAFDGDRAFESVGDEIGRLILPESLADERYKAGRAGREHGRAERIATGWPSNKDTASHDSSSDGDSSSYEGGTTTPLNPLQRIGFKIVGTILVVPCGMEVLNALTFERGYNAYNGIGLNSFFVFFSEIGLLLGALLLYVAFTDK